jgi:hypothetical protein
MIVTKIAIGLGAAIYLALWVLALSGASALVPVLLVPVILVALIGLGAWLTRFMGVPTRSPKFRDPHEDAP